MTWQATPVAKPHPIAIKQVHAHRQIGASQKTYSGGATREFLIFVKSFNGVALSVVNPHTIVVSTTMDNTRRQWRDHRPQSCTCQDVNWI